VNRHGHAGKHGQATAATCPAQRDGPLHGCGVTVSVQIRTVVHVKNPTMMKNSTVLSRDGIPV
jgi:hypothetical protein